VRNSQHDHCDNLTPPEKTHLDCCTSRRPGVGGLVESGATERELKPAPAKSKFIVRRLGTELGVAVPIIWQPIRTQRSRASP
jgi:hypothetical protein